MRIGSDPNWRESDQCRFRAAVIFFPREHGVSGGEQLKCALSRRFLVAPRAIGEPSSTATAPRS